MKKLGNNILHYNQEKEEKKGLNISEKNDKELKDNKGKSTAEDSYGASATDKQNEKMSLDYKEKSNAEDIFKVVVTNKQNITKRNSNPEKSNEKNVVKLKRKREITPIEENDGHKSISDRILENEKSDCKDINPPNYIYYGKEENDEQKLFSDLFLENENCKEDKEDEKNNYDCNVDFVLNQNDNNKEENFGPEDEEKVKTIECNNKIYK